MRKFIPSLVVAFIVAFTFVSGASAHTIQASQTNQRTRLSSGHVTPNDVSGGGCSSWNTNGTGNISAKACISYAYPYLQPDGYASFHKLSGSNQHGGIKSCRFRLKVYEGTSLLEQIDYDCLDAAKAYQQNAHFGPLSIFATGEGVAYSSAVQVNVGYNDGYGTVLYSYSSPEQFI
jgi:hypothetical protein